MADAGSQSPEIEERPVVGRRLRIVRWRSSAPRPRIRPLLFFNGIGANAEVIAPFAERLAERDVVTFDLPGVGGSPSPRLPYRLSTMARVADRIMTDLGYGEVDVMGVSWGGVLAQQFAFQYRHRTGRQVLVATSAGVVMAPGRLSAVSRLVTPRRYADPAYLHDHAATIYGGSIAALDAYHAAIRPPTLAGYLHQLLAVAGWTSLPLLPFVSAPTLILMGDQDRLVPAVNGRLLHRLIPNSRLAEVEGAGHLVLLTHLDQAVQLVASFLDEDEIHEDE